MTIMNRIVNAFIKCLYRMTCRFDSKVLRQQVPDNGPMIIVTNHINFLEAPLLYLYMRPRHTIALAKKELWDHVLTRKIMQWWQCIPVDRGKLDRNALNACFEVLDRKDILCIAPEGTRSKTGKLQKGKAGTGFIAFKKKVQILPIASFGIEHYTKNLKHFRRTPLSVRVGKPFIIESKKQRLSAEERQQVTDEMMIRIAQLIPESYHGYYAERMNEEFVFTKTIEP